MTNNNNEDNEVNEDNRYHEYHKGKEEKNSKIPERLSGVTLEQANKAVASYSMSD